MTEALVTAKRMIPPPISVWTPGDSPSAKNTHTGLNTGSMTAIRFACIAETRLIATEKRTAEKPICTIPRTAIAMSDLNVTCGSGRNIEMIKQIPAVSQWERRIDSKGEPSFCIRMKTK